MARAALAAFQEIGVRWTRKAQIQRICAALPRGDALYQQIQRRFGGLTGDPFARLPHHAEMLASLAAIGFEIEGARCLEVGTGHLPVAPVAFYLAGAREVVSVDLHRRLVPDLTSLMLHRLAEAEAHVVSLYEGLIDESALRERLRVVRLMADSPFELFQRIGIRYCAPGDAAQMPDADETFDLHFSITVIEHIDRIALPAILMEGRRLLRPGGVAAHLIDPSDHFSHSDARISAINFLRFSNPDWMRLAGNQFGYTNRMRASELEELFSRCHFDIQRCDRRVDERSMTELQGGFPIDPEFRRFDLEDLCTTTLSLYARPSG